MVRASRAPVIRAMYLRVRISPHTWVVDRRLHDPRLTRRLGDRVRRGVFRQHGESRPSRFGQPP